MPQIIINNPSVSNHGNSSLLNPDILEGDNFNIFIENQKARELPDGTYKKGLTSEGAVTFREETVDILRHLNPHNAVQNIETTHLAVGYVQSGKTMSFTGLTALAKDNGYRMVVYLAGTKNNLLDQTTDRLTKDLVGKEGEHTDIYRIHDGGKEENHEDIIGSLNLSDKPIVLVPILKHYLHIEVLTKLFNNYDFRTAMCGETVIIIDDEADQASLNSYGRKNSKGETEEEYSHTYDAIKQMRNALPGNSYVQYTATPQANILISMQDILSPKSHTLLSPGAGYIGGKQYFGHSSEPAQFGGELVIQIPDTEVFSKSRRASFRTMPSSLRKALMLHILATAIVVKWQRKDGIKFLSMMVHPDETKESNKLFKGWIEKELTKWKRALNKPDGDDDKVDLLEKFEEVLPEAVKFYPESERPSIDDLKRFIQDIINDKKVYLVNTDKEAQTKINWKQFSMHILVGAEMLNRGFTIEKLATTYMPRHSAGIANADTIQQRCRFYGYKEDYLESCRVFLPAVSIANYKEYVDHEEELRAALRRCDTLKAAERELMLSPRLRATRANVLPISVVNTKLRGNKTLYAFESKNAIDANTALVNAFIEKHVNDFDIQYNYSTADRTHRGFKLPVKEAIEFLEEFIFNNYPSGILKSETIRYLSYLSDGSNREPLEYVYFIQMAFNSRPRERDFDPLTHRLSTHTGLFAGPSSERNSTDYPGDKEIVGPDSITIQLHHLELKGATLDLGKFAYTLAINFPEQLAVSYCANIGNVEEE